MIVPCALAKTQANGNQSNGLTPMTHRYYKKLMLLGFISLLLTVFQGWIQKTCIPQEWTFDMLPCKKPDKHAGTTLGTIGRRLLSEGAVGTKLEHIIAELVHDVAKKHTAIDGDVIVKPSDTHFWFGKPRIILYLIHFILFQNSFEIAFFFWILTTYGFDACTMESVGFIVPRLVMGVLIQLICSYVTLPLYAIVTQMGSCYKKAIFNDQVQKGVLVWAKASKRASGRGLKGFGAASKKETPRSSANSEEPFIKIEMAKAGEDAEVVGNIE